MHPLGEDRDLSDFHVTNRVECKDGRVLLRVTEKTTGEDCVLVVEVIDGRMSKSGRAYPMC